MTPSVSGERSRRSNRSRLLAEEASISVRSSSARASTVVIPTTTCEKNGSLKSPGSSSTTASTTDPTRFVASARAEEFGA